MSHVIATPDCLLAEAKSADTLNHWVRWSGVFNLLKFDLKPKKKK